MTDRWRTIIEPFRIKSVEPLPFTTEDERLSALERVGYNLFGLRSEEVTIRSTHRFGHRCDVRRSMGSDHAR
jgi:tryptophanase